MKNAIKSRLRKLLEKYDGTEETAKVFYEERLELMRIIELNYKHGLISENVYLECYDLLVASACLI